MSDLRTRITKVIWKTFQNTPPIDATDDEWESWWDDSTQEGKALSYAQADAVIRELGLRRETVTTPNLPNHLEDTRYVTDWKADE